MTPSTSSTPSTSRKKVVSFLGVNRAYMKRPSIREVEGVEEVEGGWQVRTCWLVHTKGAHHGDRTEDMATSA